MVCVCVGGGGGGGVNNLCMIDYNLYFSKLFSHQTPGIND